MNPGRKGVTFRPGFKQAQVIETWSSSLRWKTGRLRRTMGLTEFYFPDNTCAWCSSIVWMEFQRA